MTDLTPIDVKSAEAIGRTLESFKTAIVEARKASAEARAEATELRRALDDKLGSQATELKTFGTTFGDTKSKLDDIATKMADAAGKIADAETKYQSLVEDSRKQAEALENVFQELKKRPAGSDDERKAAAKLREHALVCLQIKADEKNERIPTDVTADEIAVYGEHKQVFDKYLRMGSSVAKGQEWQHLSQTEQKAVSTFTHGNRFWLPTEFSDRIIACYKLDTNLTDLVDTITIGRGAVDLMVDNYVSDEAQWACEIGGTNGTTDTQLPGSQNFAVHEQRAKIAVSNTMIEDAAIDIQSWIAMRAGRQFIRGLNRTIMTGNGVGMPDGILRASNHLSFQSGKAGGTAGGDFSWQDLTAMGVFLDPRFQGNAMWLASTPALASIMMMTDGMGRPIFSAAVINGEGLPTIMGRPYRQVVQLAPPVNTTGVGGAFVPGAKPLLLGDWRQHYMLVLRRGFTAFRDPYTAIENNLVIWRFSQRVGGGVLCKNAAMALEIV